MPGHREEVLDRDPQPRERTRLRASGRTGERVAALPPHRQVPRRRHRISPRTRAHQPILIRAGGHGNDKEAQPTVAFTPEHIERDIELFRDRARQYVFISSASAYQKPPARLPIVESTRLRNPFWQYSSDKIACEERLTRAYRDSGFPVTIVRPSHTYDRTKVPFDGGLTALSRMRQGREVIVHGDGTSLWTLTHHEDFARGFIPLLGHPGAVGTASISPRMR
jgi:hypothetical protein